MRIRTSGGMTFVLMLAALLIAGCGNTPDLATDPTPTPTPTELVVIDLATPTEKPGPCDGLVGTIEIQVLVGPSEVVGMEPVSVGNVPFNVTNQGGIYLVDGSGPLLFDEQVYEAEWGTYTVNFSADTTVEGECVVSGETAMLDLVIVMEGEQNVVVEAEGFQGEYPWSGTQQINASLPVEEGASASGEGWAVVLHLGK